jgi:hypothetical protein
MKRRTALVLILVLFACTMSISAQNAFDGMAADAWETLSVREQLCTVTGILLGATFLARSYDAAHPNNFDPVLDHYIGSGISTDRLRMIVTNAYKDPRYRNIPFTALILRWDEVPGGDDGR